MKPSLSVLVFLKLGGSLITDKNERETIRSDVLARVAREIKGALLANPNLTLVLGHGAGSFGHVAAAHHSTRDGVAGEKAWKGFCDVSLGQQELNRRVTKALLDEGIPAISLRPSASASCRDGGIVSLATASLLSALRAGLVPVVCGDVAFDEVRGGTIVSTEEVFSYLAGALKPDFLLLAGETDGVYAQDGQVIPLITRDNLDEIAAALGGSGGIDVTGGMASKVRSMLDLSGSMGPTGAAIRIFSGIREGCLAAVLSNPVSTAEGTVVAATAPGSRESGSSTVAAANADVSAAAAMAAVHAAAPATEVSL